MDKQEVYIKDDFWTGYATLIRETVIPYQWEALNDRIDRAAPSYAIRNFRIAAGLEEGAFGGKVFQDSDVYKWLEAVAYSLARQPDSSLEQRADSAIALIEKAQHDDGYVNTYFTIQQPGKQWTNLYQAHELYCAGHLIEAAVAYAQGTGKTKLLQIATRFADLIDRLFGSGRGQIRGYCGHQEIELALVKLYELTRDKRYLNLSLFFIEERGRRPHFFVEEWQRNDRSYFFSAEAFHLQVYQSLLPVREQSVPVGHAVRAVYMYTAMADLARLTADETLREACERLWGNTVGKQMYITGGVGSTHQREAFTTDYDLPNDTIYAETCASIGLIFWARRMLKLEAKSEYADVMERALYNNVLGSMSQDGKHFFYVNPLEVWPQASANNPDKKHVKARRQKWFGCSCCPPNVARLIASIHDYIYDVSAKGQTVYTHLYIGSEIRFVTNGREVLLRQRSAMPWSGEVEFAVAVEGGDDKEVSFELALRVPHWAEAGTPLLEINGGVQAYGMRSGYAILKREWSNGDRVKWRLPMETKRMAAHPQIRADAGKVALQRGPLVYCMEEADHEDVLASLSIAKEPNMRERLMEDELGPYVAVDVDGQADDASVWPEGRLYQAKHHPLKRVRVRAIPYYLWGNRQAGEMQVWIRSQ